MIKKILLLSSIWLVSSCVCLEQDQNHAVGLSPITTTTHTNAVNSHIVDILKEIVSALDSSSNTSSLTALLQKIDSGVTVNDVQLIQQALQQALQILEAGHGLNPVTAIEYAAIILDTLSQL